MNFGHFGHLSLERITLFLNKEKLFFQSRHLPRQLAQQAKPTRQRRPTGAKKSKACDFANHGLVKMQCLIMSQRL